MSDLFPPGPRPRSKPDAIANRIVSHALRCPVPEIKDDERAELELKRVKTEHAEAALRALAEAMSVEPGYTPEQNKNPFLNTASGRAVNDAVNTLKSVFGDNIKLYFDEPEKRTQADSEGRLTEPPPSRGYVCVEIEKVSFVDNRDERSGLNLNGLQAPILLRLWECQIWYLLLYNSKLFGVDLRGVSSPAPPYDENKKYKEALDGTWFAAYALELTGYFDVANCHFQLFAATGLKAHRLQFDRDVLIDGAQQLSNIALPKLKALFHEILVRLQEDNCLSSVNLSELKICLASTRYREIVEQRTVVQLISCDLQEAYLTMSCLGCATFQGTRVSSVFEISGRTYIDPLFPMRCFLEANQERKARYAVIDPLRDLTDILDEIAAILKTPGLGGQSGGVTPEDLKILGELVDAWSALDEFDRWPVLDFRNMRIDGRFALLKLGKLTLGAPEDGDSDRDWVKSRLKKLLPMHSIEWSASPTHISGVSGFVNFDGAKCHVFSDDEAWWADRDAEAKIPARDEHDHSLRFNACNFEYQYFAQLPESTREPYIDASGSKSVDVNDFKASHPISWETIGKRKSAWLGNAFVSDSDVRDRFDAQPWTQCAMALKRAGLREHSQKVLYEREVRVREQGRSPNGKLGSTFGYRVMLPFSILTYIAITGLLAIEDIHMAYSSTIFANALGPFVTELIPLGFIATLAIWLLWGASPAKLPKSEKTRTEKFKDLLRARDLSRLLKAAETTDENAAGSRRSHFEELFLRMLRYTIGYGYKPERALYWAAGIVFVGTAVFAFASATGRMVEKSTLVRVAESSPRSSVVAGDAPLNAVNGFGHRCVSSLAPIECKVHASDYRDTTAKSPSNRNVLQAPSGRDAERGAQELFNPFVYAVDTFVPIIDFGQGEKWEPVNYRDPPKGGWWERFGLFMLLCSRLFMIAAGWWITTVILAYLTGLLDVKE